jgi:hypothetical protein
MKKPKKTMGIVSLAVKPSDMTLLTILARGGACLRLAFLVSSKCSRLSTHKHIRAPICPVIQAAPCSVFWRHRIKIRIAPSWEVGIDASPERNAKMELRPNLGLQVLAKTLWGEYRHAEGFATAKS